MNWAVSLMESLRHFLTQSLQELLALLVALCWVVLRLLSQHRGIRVHLLGKDVVELHILNEDGNKIEQGEVNKNGK